jgi:hypothetical protein
MPAPATTHTERYGATIALVDGLSMAAVVAGLVVAVSQIDSSSDEDETFPIVLVLGGCAGYVLGGPLVHHYKHNDRSAWISLGLRLGLPTLGSVIGASATRNDPDGSGAGGSLASLGLVSAMVIDWVVLAKHQVADVAVMPYVSPNPGGGMSAGLGGRF